MYVQVYQCSTVGDEHSSNYNSYSGFQAFLDSIDGLAKLSCKSFDGIKYEVCTRFKRSTNASKS